MKRLACVLIAAAATSCTVGPDYVQPTPLTPDTFRGAPNSFTSFADLAWFEIFDDPVLQELIGRALAQNYDLRIAAERVVEARAAITVADSGDAPQIDARALHEQALATRNGTIPPPQRDSRLTTVGGAMAWDLDFWGRFARATEAARADLLATEAAREVVIQTLVTDLAITYFELLELDAELEIARRTVASRENSLRLVELRLERGVSNAVEQRQAQNLVLTAERLIPGLEQAIQQRENLIRLLVGDLPGPVPRASSDLRTADRDIEIPVGVPSQLLERRPDVRGAEARLVAANARIGEAKALLYPNVSLTGFLGRASEDLDDLTRSGSGAWNIAPTVSLPIFTGGRLEAGVEISESQQRQAALDYLGTLQQAFVEVADALVVRAKTREIREVQARVDANLAAQLELSNMRYRGGVTSYLEVLDTERDRFESELQLVRAVRDELIAIVVLYRALGGGWQSSEGWAAAGPQEVERPEPQEVP